MSKADTATCTGAPATLDQATLDITAILQHVIDVETSLPPPRSTAHTHGAAALTGGRSNNVATNNKNINTHPDVQVVQLPRYDRRRDATNFDDEDVDMFLVAARTSRVVGAGLVTVSRRGAKRSKRTSSNKMVTGIGGDGGDGDDPCSSDDDNDAEKNFSRSEAVNFVGYGDLTDPMGGDRYGPVTICCAFGEEEEDIGGEGGEYEDESNEDLDELITCLSILNLKDSPNIQNPGGSFSDEGDHRVAVVLGTSFGRVLSTELGVHFSRGIRRIDGGDGGSGSNATDPFEPLPLDYDDDEMFEYYDQEGRRQVSGAGSGSVDAVGRDVTRDSSIVRGSSGGGHGSNGGGALHEDDRIFHPEGGVKSISIHVDRHKHRRRRTGSSSTTFLPLSSSVVSVAYGDGTFVRLPHYAFFKSVIDSLNGCDNDQKEKIAVRRFKLDQCGHTTSSTESTGGSDGGGGSSGSVLFLPKSHPSLLSPVLVRTSPNCISRPESPSPTSDGDSAEVKGTEATAMDVDDSDQEMMAGKRSDEDNDYDFCEAVTFGCTGGSAIQFHSSNKCPPSLFPGGSNEEEAKEEEHSQDGGLGLVTGAVVGVAAGVFGAAMGAVSWGLGGGKAEEEKESGSNGPHQSSRNDGGHYGDSNDPDIFSRLRDRPADEMGNGISLLDPPRNITSVVVDPDGDFSATTDTLGRVLLIELSTKQIVRIWKGVRDATCCWIQAPRPSHLSQWGKKNQLYLAIHCGQRRTVEVWRVTHGPRVAIQNVSRDATLIPCIGPASEGSLARCFILDPSSLAGTKNMMCTVSIVDPDIGLHPNVSHKKKFPKPTTKQNSDDISSSTPKTTTNAKHQAPAILISSTPQPSANDAIQLQLLKQQLASETNLPSSPDAIFDTCTQIGSLSDLSTALDLLSTASHLEEGMGIQGSAFHRRVLEHCEKRLDVATKAHATSNNPHLRALQTKIGYHKQILSAYDILHKFEERHLATEITADATATAPDAATPWMKEALGWIEASEKVAPSTATHTMGTTALKFSSFAKSCMPLSTKDIASISEKDLSVGSHPIHLIESKRDRTTVLLHIFRPLLKDIFVYKVVNNVFDTLRLSADHEALQRYFGEWFLSLPRSCASDMSLVVRWLQELAFHYLTGKEKENAGGGITEEQGTPIILGCLHEFCSSCDDLPRAFLLAAICRKAVSLATKQQEAKTYGKVLTADEVLPWDCLLRKLRVCLLITLRLYGIQLGSFPVTIANIDDGSIFSIYQWVARDELFLSHNHSQIQSLEESCRLSPHSFDPSCEEGDDSARWGLLQQARVDSTSIVVDEPGPLLLYLSGFNDSIKLAAHRVLLLGEKWGKDPQSIDILKDAVPAINFLHESGEEYQGAVTAAVCIELWQTRIRPVYRALLFGFDDVPELSEDIVAPLCLDLNWMGELSDVSLVVLSLLGQSAGESATDQTSEDPLSAAAATVTNAATFALQKLFGDDNAEENENNNSAEMNTRNNIWPKNRDDIILRNLISRARPATPVSLDIHRAIVCAAKLTDDLASLSYCVPTFADMFLQGSLFEEMSAPTEFSELQEEFINDVVLKKALKAEGTLIDQTELEELETLAYAWGVERIRLRAQFLLHMYDAGKDHMISDLANMSNEQLDYPLVVEGGLEIACARLSRILIELKRAKIFRSILAMLDAETCKWIKKEAEKAADHLITSTEYDIDDDDDFQWQSPPLSSTHALVLRLLRMSSSVGDSNSSQKAHSLSILSGSLLNAVQEHSELREYGFDWLG